MKKSGVWIIHKPSEGTELTAMKTQFPIILQNTDSDILMGPEWVPILTNACLCVCN